MAGRVLCCVVLTSLIAVNVALYVPQDGVKSPAEKEVIPAGCEYIAEEKETICSMPYSQLMLEKLKRWNVYQLDLFPDLQPLNSVKERFSLEGLESLKYLHVQKIFIPTLDEWIFDGSPNLLKVNIVYCNVTHVATTVFDSLVHLTTLNLSNNAIGALSADSFKNLVSLTRLDLSKNFLTSLPYDLFDGLNNLQEIDLSWNLIQELPRGLFSSLSNLFVLHLQGNDIMNATNILHNLTSVQMLDLSSNSIQFIGQDSLESLSKMTQVLVSRNPFQCTCLLEQFITAVLTNSSRFGNELFTCYGPGEMVIGKSFVELNITELPCEAPSVSFITEPLGVLHHSDLHLNCQVMGSPPLGMYWITPWGQKFAHPDFQHLLPNDIKDSKSRRRYFGVSFESSVYVNADGSLHVDRFRGYFAGEFKCVSVNLLGTANKSVIVEVKTMFTSNYYSSLYMGSICAGALLMIAIVLGTIRFIINRFCQCLCCCCCSTDRSNKSTSGSEEESDNDEADDSEEMDDHSYDEDDSEYETFYDFNTTPKTPVNSPLFRTPRMTPKKCPTPSEDYDSEKPMAANIWETLEEAKARLKFGAERNMERVRCQVKSIRSTGTVKIKRIRQTGSLKIQSMRETGSHAASYVRNSVVLGMEQVKYGVMSIKEFCGTGEMGPGTVSVATISSTVDTGNQGHGRLRTVSHSVEEVAEESAESAKQQAITKSKTV